LEKAGSVGREAIFRYATCAKVGTKPGIGPGKVRNRTAIIIFVLFVDELDELVAFDLGIRLEVSIIDQPCTNPGVGPGTPDSVLSVGKVVTRGK